MKALKKTLTLACMVLLLGMLFGSTPAQAQTFAYVTNFSTNDVSVIATASNTVVATIAVGSSPDGVAITPEVTVTAVCPPAPFENCSTSIDIQIDMTGTTELLGSFTATLTWDTTIIDYTGNSGLPAGFTEVINEDDVATRLLTLSSANVNANGASGLINALTVNFDVIGNEDDVNTFDLEFSAMAAAETFTDLLPILTTNDCSSTIDDGGVLGDVNNDGLVNSTDALIVLSHDISLPIPA